MRQIILNRIVYYKEIMRKAVLSENYGQANEAQLLINELEVLLKTNENQIEFDLQSIIEENYYSSKQVATKIRKSHTTVIRQVQKSKLKGFMVGRDYFFSKHYIDSEINKS